jgi:hypothetical protein
MPGGEEENWFYRDPKADTVKGPLNLVGLSALLATGSISGETLTRCGDYGVWRRFREQSEFQSAQRRVAAGRSNFDPDVLKEKAPAIFSLKWFYGFGYVAVGTLVYESYLSSRAGGQGVSLDWLIDLIRHWLGYHS